MAYLFIVAATALCAFMAIRARHLIMAALWLAGASALVSIALYASGAHLVAVIELSVGAGLVTVLFVFAISIAGDDALQKREFIPNGLAIALAVGYLALMAVMVLPLDTTTAVVEKTPFADVMWHDRVADTLAQLVFIFTGVLCLLGLITDEKVPEHLQTRTAEIEEIMALPHAALPDEHAEMVAAAEREEVLA
jgi:NADH:ubiquinone oxidoreductase subunit 6 (subunit J)